MRKKNYTKMWNLLHEVITGEAEAAYNEIKPELSLFAAIIVQAGRDRDFKYFKSNDFFNHCKLLRTNCVSITYKIRHAIELEDSGRPFPELDNYDHYGYALYEEDDYE